MSDDLWRFLEIGLPVLIVVILIFLTIRMVARFYKKISPNQLAVISGRKYKDKATGVERGFRYIIGGGTFLIPILEKMELMSLNTIQVKAAVENVPDKNGALVSVTAIANVKIQSSDQSVPLAIERFLGTSEEGVRAIIQNTLEGNLRAIVGKMEIEELLRDRQAFMQNVLGEAGADLGKMGLSVDVAQIQDIRDARGYIESLGKKKTAEIVRDATVGEAEAKRDADQQSAEARRIGETAKAASEQSISNANKDRDVTIAENDAFVQAKKAQVPIAARIAEAQRTQELNVATVEAQKAQVTAEIELQAEKAKRNSAELDATTVTTATKNREARLIEADASRQAAELEGEASRIKAEKEGLGQQAKDTGAAEGRKRLASANQAELEAAAGGEKAKLLAAAAGKQADLEAVAAGELAMANARKATLLAEAEGALRKAEAYAKLDQGGRFLMILQALPPVIDALGLAAEKSAKPFAEAIGQGLGNIKDVRIVDLGGGLGGGRNVLGQFANTPVEALYGVWQKVQAVGAAPLVEALAEKLGIDLKTVFRDAPLDGAPIDIGAVASRPGASVAGQMPADHSPAATS